MHCDTEPADVEKSFGFGMPVLEQDAGLCEINPRGLRSMRNKGGVLMPEDHELHRLARKQMKQFAPWRNEG